MVWGFPSWVSRLGIRACACWYAQASAYPYPGSCRDPSFGYKRVSGPGFRVCVAVSVSGMRPVDVRERELVVALVHLHPQLGILLREARNLASLLWGLGLRV